MSLFDAYRPVPEISCPACNQPLDDWQGKDGPCLMLVWVQGHAAPIDQSVDEESRLPPEILDQLRLPEEFYFHTEGCRCGRVILARGRCVDGVWSESEPITPANARPGPHQSEREFRAYVRDLERWLAAEA
jgi:hypothetical protein